jgi:hypothetical protein
VNVTCPHCSKRFKSEEQGFSDAELELVDVAGDGVLSVFPVLSPGQERHVDERLCCQDCYDRADDRRRDEAGKKIGPHRYAHEFHVKHRLDKAVGEKR